ncbi:hypothetical protein D9M71_733700 [compost metagenome]
MSFNSAAVLSMPSFNLIKPLASNNDSIRPWSDTELESKIVAPSGRSSNVLYFLE